MDLFAFNGMMWKASSGANSQENTLEHLSLGTEWEQVSAVTNTVLNIRILSFT